MPGLYLHIPFCRRKCIYCDFYSVGEKSADWPRFVSAIINEAKSRAEGYFSPSDVNTIYIGGGTPSLIPPGEFLRLCGYLTSIVPNISEFTIEVNPDDVTPEMADAWMSAGVNRVSMGVQSLFDSELKMLGRRHNSQRAIEAFNILRQRFENISLDIMFGLPGQTLESLRDSAYTIVDLSPEHISAYSLMYEERTALTGMCDRGVMKEIDETDCVEMFRTISEMFSDSGYEQYEISNYARHGKKSVHNSSYWQGAKYIGLGPSAHSYDGERCRSYNTADLKLYTRRWSDNDLSIETSQCEILTDEELREEYIMTRLRTREGINIEEYELRFGSLEMKNLMSKAGKFLASHDLQIQSRRLSLAPRGIMISDEIISELF